jgi:hypothetical protein
VARIGLPGEPISLSATRDIAAKSPDTPDSAARATFGQPGPAPEPSSII